MLVILTLSRRPYFIIIKLIILKSLFIIISCYYLIIGFHTNLMIRVIIILLHQLAVTIIDYLFLIILQSNLVMLIV